MILDYLPLIVIIVAVGVFAFLLIRKMPAAKEQAQKVVNRVTAKSKRSSKAQKSSAKSSPDTDTSGITTDASATAADAAGAAAGGFIGALKKGLSGAGQLLAKLGRLIAAGFTALFTLIKHRVSKTSRLREEDPEKPLTKREREELELVERKGDIFSDAEADQSDRTPADFSKSPDQFKPEVEVKPLTSAAIATPPSDSQKKPPKDSTAEETSLTKAARRHLMNGKLKEAEETYIKLVTVNPKNKDAYRGLGEVYLRTKNYSDARESFKMLITLGEKSAAAYGNLALTYYNQKKYEKAVKAYSRSLKIAPDAAFRQANLGRSLLALNDNEAALEAFQKAVKHDPKNIDYLNLLARTAKKIRDFSLAKKTYEKILSLESENKAARKELAELEKLL